MREIDPLVSAFSHLKTKPREAEALKSLQKIASLVKPVMRQRGWRVGTLREFYPEERNLLGVNWNRGQEICLRLRYPSDERQFLPMEQVVDTMLHELSHIVHDAHDAKFHGLWQQLRDEHEELTRKGYTGEGFLSKGQKLGGKRIPMDEARRRARASAEKRRVVSAGSGQKLGGKPVRRGADMRKVIADATQRRLTVTQGCASGSKDSKAVVDQASKNGFRTQAEEDDANERAIMEAYIELIQQEEREKWGDSYSPASAENPSGSAGEKEHSAQATMQFVDAEDDPQQGRLGSSVVAATAAPRSSSDSSVEDITKPSKRMRPEKHLPDQRMWPCPICTLENPKDFLCCGACGTERASENSEDPDEPMSSTASPRTNSRQRAMVDMLHLRDDEAHVMKKTRFEVRLYM
ncbi:MAG: hypothetical protein M1833_005912 [Piccolia ochrophora]|nr:MAG: hypothetical protein M1833_005912 [Piccolia ochrophora]